MRHWPFLLLITMLLAACNTGSSSSPAVAEGVEWAHRDLPVQEDNVRSDTLVIYTTHDLGDGTFLMAAKRMEDDREGLRLMLYRPRPDSTAEVLASSAPAYDSWTMLPTFFTSGNAADGWLILANYGERQSWGQKVFLLKDHRFQDLGFIDVAERGWRTEEDSTYQWRTSIAPRVTVHRTPAGFTFGFTGDSVQVYDDLAGRTEVMLPAQQVQYRYEGGTFRLVIAGEARSARTPS